MTVTLTSQLLPASDHDLLFPILSLPPQDGAKSKTQILPWKPPRSSVSC
jgi:hypothetical protein